MPDMPNFNDGDVLSADSLNTMADQIDDITKSSYGNTGSATKPLVTVRLSSGQTSHDDAGAEINWETYDDDPDSMWDSDHPSRLTVNTAGVWLIMGQIVIGVPSSSGNFGAYIVPTGLTGRDSYTANEAGVLTSGVKVNIRPVTCFKRFKEGDQFSMRVYTGTGSDQTMSPSDYGGTYLSAVFLGP